MEIPKADLVCVISPSLENVSSDGNNSEETATSRSPVIGEVDDHAEIYKSSAAVVGSTAGCSNENGSITLSHEAVMRMISVDNEVINVPVRSQSINTIVEPQSDQDERIEWFRNIFMEMENPEIILAKDMTVVSKQHEGFAENLFKLFDTDHSDSVSMQELVGGLRRLTNQRDKVRPNILKWFQKVFIQVSGKEEILQLEDFKTAVKTNGFVDRLYQLIDVDHTGHLTLAQILEALQNLSCLNRDTKWLEWLQHQFYLVARGKDHISLHEFKKALNVKTSFFAERFFHLFDKDGSGCINFEEFMSALTLLISGSKVDKLFFLFQVYDMDGNGLIHYEELHTVLQSCIDESNFQFTEQKLDELAKTLFENTDKDNNGSITFEELQEELNNYPGVVENLTISAAKWLNPPNEDSIKRGWKQSLPYWMSWHYLQNNLAWVSWVTAFVLVNCFLLIEASIRHRSGGVALAIARGSGQCLNFNPTFIIIVMLRKGNTWLRSTRLAFLFPLDHHIDLHKICGWTIFLFSIIHTIAHLINFVLLSLMDDGLQYWQYLFTVHTGFGWVGGAAGLTGLTLLAILLIMVIFSLPIVRNKGFFQVFYWTHNLFVLWYLLLILHAIDFWKWFLVPGFIYILERAYRSKWIKLAQYGLTSIKEGLLLSSNVIHLVLDRPVNFSYQPGDYIFIQIPDIAKYEWHPFTISSAPEQQGFMWLHIHAVGTWTKKLYEFFEKRNKLEENQVRIMELSQYSLGSRRQESTPPTATVRSSISSDSMESQDDANTLPTINRISMQSMLQMTHGQDFSHLIKQPALAHILIREDEKEVDVYIDGPYGTPSTHIFQAEHAVLIGAGIGVTPFASILQSIMIKYRNSLQHCPRCDHRWNGETLASVMRLKKVDFFWINRDQKSFEWFASLLSQLEIEQSEQCGFEHFLEMHMYMTSALQNTDIKAIGLQIALDLIHKKDKRDFITGLKTRTHAGRPDWNEVFQKLESDRQGKVTVFFCGPSAISSVLKRKCSQFGFQFRKEIF